MIIRFSYIQAFIQLKVKSSMVKRLVHIKGFNRCTKNSWCTSTLLKQELFWFNTLKPKGGDVYFKAKIPSFFR